MSNITFSGLASGLDTNSLIAGLVNAERAPITRLQAKQSLIDSKSRKLTTLKTRLDDLRTAALALDSRSEAMPTKAKSADESVLVATGSGGASLGRFDVRVERLASAPKVYSNGFSARDATGLFGTGTLSLAVGSSTANLTIDGTDTLDSVVSKVNNAGLGLTAGVLFDGTQYRLQISGAKTGAANALTIGEGSLTLGVSSAANIKSTGQDARIWVDGFSIDRSTNQISDAISGVTLDLKAVSSGTTTTTVEIGNDVTTLGDRLQRIVETWNNVNTFINAESVYTGTTKPADSLSGDSTVRGAQSALRTALATPVAGLTGAYTTLASIGVSISRDGVLSLDRSKLTTAISANAEAVAAVLGQSGTGAMTAIANAASQYTDSTNGALSQRISSMSRQRADLGKQIDRVQARIDKYETQLRTTFTAMEKTVSNLQGQGSQLSSVLSRMSG